MLFLWLIEDNNNRKKNKNNEGANGRPIIQDGKDCQITVINHPYMFMKDRKGSNKNI